MKSEDLASANETLKNMAFPMRLTIENPDGTTTDAFIKGLSKKQLLMGMLLSGAMKDYYHYDFKTIIETAGKVADSILEYP